MKLVTTIFLLFIIPLHGYQTSNEIPELNQKITSFVTQNIGKKIGRGECWDLAAQALNQVGASWDGQYNFGRIINHKKDNIYPGDIIQFNKVKTLKKEQDELIKGSYPVHTAVVYQIIRNGLIKMAEQNTSEFGKKVGISEFDIQSVISGKVTFYRPKTKDN
jgi:hypothetical protein